MTQPTLKWLSILALAISLAACGGGESSDKTASDGLDSNLTSPDDPSTTDPGTTDPTTPSQTGPTSIQGKVLAGYIYGRDTLVCIDTNDNWTCDDSLNEPRTYTNGDGTFSFSNLDGSVYKRLLVYYDIGSIAAADEYWTSTMYDDYLDGSDGQPIQTFYMAAPYQIAIDHPNDVIISPLTTLLAQLVSATTFDSSAPTMTLAQAEAKIKQDLDLNTLSLQSDDYIELQYQGNLEAMAVQTLAGLLVLVNSNGVVETSRAVVTDSVTGSTYTAIYTQLDNFNSENKATNSSLFQFNDCTYSQIFSDQTLLPTIYSELQETTPPDGVYVSEVVFDTHKADFPVCSVMQ